MIVAVTMFPNHSTSHQWRSPTTTRQVFNPHLTRSNMAYAHTQWHPPPPPQNQCSPVPPVAPRHFRFAYPPILASQPRFRPPNPPMRLPQAGQQRPPLKRHQPFTARGPRKMRKTGTQRRTDTTNSSKRGSALNPTDPLNLQDLMKETERRRTEGLSPLRGDSRMNTPVTSISGESPRVGVARIGAALTESIRLLDVQDNNNTTPKTGAKEAKQSSSSFARRRSSRRLPKTGNYANYYARRDPKERIQYLMPEWFVGKDVADYGCHNGTMTFAVLDAFPEVNRIDAIDCDAELIANARHMQRERMRWNPGDAKLNKVNFQVGNWVDQSSTTDEPTYDTILAFSVTKWLHLNHGDVGLMRFFRRAFNLLKPGGHLVLEPQPRSSYKRTRFTASQHASYRNLKIDPSKLEPLLLDLGFSYFDTIKVPQANQPFKRHIMLCSKSYGATPASIRNDFREEAHTEPVAWPSPPRVATPEAVREPPPVNYCPQTPSYVLSPLSPSVAVSSTSSSSSSAAQQTAAAGGVAPSSSSLASSSPATVPAIAGSVSSEAVSSSGQLEGAKTPSISFVPTDAVTSCVSPDTTHSVLGSSPPLT